MHSSSCFVLQRVLVPRVVGSVATVRTPHRTMSSGARNPSQEKKLKVAIIGGGPAGLCAALHLAPLVSYGIIQDPIDVYEAKSSCLDTQDQTDTIGVGLWSTAIDPFLTSPANSYGELRPSYQLLLQQLVSVGCFVTNVGYRTPNGSWITQTTLSSQNLSAHHKETSGLQQPSLLFLQRHSLLKAFYDAISIEEQQQTIQMHYGHKIQSITQGGEDYEATLSFVKEQHKDGTEKKTKPYNLIIVAEGMNSNLRRKYSTHRKDNSTKQQQQQQHKDPKQDTQISSTWTYNRDIEDRGYYVFRANTTHYSGTSLDSFQTWGDKNSMRFAVVPCSILPTSNEISTRPLVGSSAAASQQSEHLQPIQGYTWFFTTNDSSFTDANIHSSKDRKDRILDSLRHWHDPIAELIQSTRAQDILMERAVAHRTSASALGAKFERNTSVTHLPPIVCFIGDSDRTVDPVLAQGITIGMEDASCVAKCIEHAFFANDLRHFLEVVKEKLIQSHQEKKEGRLKCLVNATNLVQSLAQPSDKLSELVTRFIVRPFAVHFVPESIKRKCFHWVMNYSLGLSKKIM